MNCPFPGPPSVVDLAALGAAVAWASGKDPVAGAIGGFTESLLDNTIGEALRQNGVTLGQWGQLGCAATAMFAGGLVRRGSGSRRPHRRSDRAKRRDEQRAALTTKYIDERTECIKVHGVAGCQHWTPSRRGKNGVCTVRHGGSLRLIWYKATRREAASPIAHQKTPRGKRQRHACTNCARAAAFMWPLCVGQ